MQNRDSLVRKHLEKSPIFTIGFLTSKKPNVRSVKLSQVLEKGSIPERYFLSPKACAGILRRAEKRGKKLPPMLQDALEEQVTSSLEKTATP